MILNEINNYTYSKRSHLHEFKKSNLDLILFNEDIDIDYCDLKRYQDLLVFTFIRNNIPKGSKILEIGGGSSRIINYFKNDYECWNLDKLEGAGNGPNNLKVQGFNLVKAYIGEFAEQLPEDYFDFVFSISALEHVPESDESLFSKILKDINRVQKRKTYSFHLFDIVSTKHTVWANKLLHYLFQNTASLNRFIDFNTMTKDTDLYHLSEGFYNDFWTKYTNKSFEDFGKAISYQIIWKKI